MNYSRTERDLSRETYTEHGDGTATLERFDPSGTLVYSETITGLPIEPDHYPLDPHGQLVTLLVVDGVLSLEDAEHVVGPEVTADDIVAEAEAWSLGNPPV